MRTSIVRLVNLGQLPDEAAAEVPHLQEYEAALKDIEPPLSKDEAVALLSVLPSSDSSCFGLAWSVLHLIESAPNWPYREAQIHSSNPWVQSMLERAARYALPSCRENDIER